MRPVFLALPLFALLPLLACGSQFHPETLVDSMRVLSVVAEPPEIAPGGSTSLNALEIDPSRPGGVTSIFWLGCDPDPADFNRSTCADVGALLKPSTFAALPPDLTLLGFGTPVRYSTKRLLFDSLAANDPVRVNGTSGPVLLVAVQAEVTATTSLTDLRALFEQMERGEVASVLALTRVLISERTQRNLNPHLSGILVDGVPLPRGARVQVPEGGRVALHLEAPVEAREPYTLVLPSGPSTRTERLVASWYSSAGRFTLPRVDLDGADDTHFVGPGGAADDPVPPRRFGTIWIVLRDDRGGEHYETVPFYVCDDSPEPLVTAVSRPSASQVALTGQHLDSLLDVEVGPAIIERTSYDASRGTVVGELPALPPGRWPLWARSKGCGRLDTGFSVDVP